MRGLYLLLAYGGLSLADGDTQEPESLSAPDVDVLEALGRYGIDVGTLPQLETLEFTTEPSGCDTAVSDVVFERTCV
jgi:hypothetical protein